MQIKNAISIGSFISAAFSASVAFCFNDAAYGVSFLALGLLSLLVLIND